MHPPSIPPALRSPRGVGSGQGIPRHTGGPAYRCSLPGLAGFAGSRRVGPSLHRLPARLSPNRGNLGREFDPARADCGYRAPLPPRLARPRWLTAGHMAEREGFEPSVRLLDVHTISSRAPSSTRASLRSAWRRGWDSNPRGGSAPPTRFRVEPVATTSVPLRGSVTLSRRSGARAPGSGRDGGTQAMIADRAVPNNRLTMDGTAGGGDQATRWPGRRARKNSWRRAWLSAARTPATTSTRWFQRGSSRSRARLTTAPPLGSGAP